MTAELPTALLREGFLLLAQVGGPFVLVLLLVGLGIGVFQAATQINDPAVGYLPRLVAGVVMSYLLGNWMMERMARYLVVAFERMASR